MPKRYRPSGDYYRVGRASIKEIARLRRKFPRSEYGLQAFKRGVDTSIFGETAALANEEQKARRKEFGYTGRGGYIKMWNKTGLGKTVAGALRSQIKRYTGSGMYTGSGAYQTNSLISDGSNPIVPEFSPEPDESGTVVISRREYISDIYAPAITVPFSIQRFPLNPGIESTFPWLSQIAQNYDEYELEQCIFTFKSTTTDIGSSTTGQCGTVIMATNYNAAAPNFDDKSVMMEYMGAMSCKTTESMQHGVECDPAKLSGSPGNYVRSNPIVSGQDLKTYDHGSFQIAVANTPSQYANNTLGELWISYTVKLRKPKFFVGRGLGISRDILVSQGGFGTGTATLNFGSSANWLYGQQNNIGIAIRSSGTYGGLTATNANPVYIFPAQFAGHLQIMYASEGTTISFTTFPTISIGGNVTNVPDMYGSNQGVSTNPSNVLGAAGTAQCVCIYHVKVSPATNGIDNAFQLVGSWQGTTALSQATVEVCEYNAGFSYKGNGLGSSDSPILVNAQGTIVSL